MSSANKLTLAAISSLVFDNLHPDNMPSVSLAICSVEGVRGV